jgi:hypothetical protein
MATTIRFETQFTRDSLLSLRADIDQLLALPRLDQPSAAGPLDIAIAKVQALWPHIGKNSRRFLVTVAQMGDYTFEDVATKLRVNIKTARAWHRNISRSMKHVDQRFGPEPPLLGESRWDGVRNYYRMWMNVKAAVLEISGEVPRG